MTAPAPIGDDDLQAYVDDVLPIERRIEVDAYLIENPQVMARVKLEREQRQALRGRLKPKFTEPIPARLRISSIKAHRRVRLVIQLRRAAAIMIILGAGGVAGWFAKDVANGSAPTSMTVATKTVAQDAVAAHRTFVVEVAHPVEVRAGEEEHLIQWLSKRLGRKLSAPDLASFGYRLMGGRLLPAGSAAAAMLMYDDDRGTRLTVYVRADEGAETAFRFMRDGDVMSIAWLDQGFGFVVSAATDRNRLLPIAEAVYRSLDSTAPAQPMGG